MKLAIRCFLVCMFVGVGDLRADTFVRFRVTDPGKAEFAVHLAGTIHCTPIVPYYKVTRRSEGRKGKSYEFPCIERNAMGSVKAINASRLALNGKGAHFVSLDKVIKTMKDTGRDMKTKYKETSRGGLAVNVVEC